MKEQIKKVVFVALVAAFGFAAQAEGLFWCVQNHDKTIGYSTYLFVEKVNSGSISSSGTYALSYKEQSINDVLGTLKAIKAGTATASDLGYIASANNNAQATTVFWNQANISFFTLVVDNVNLSSANNYLIAKTSSGDQIVTVDFSKGSYNSTINKYWDSNDNKTSWATIASINVPEPTSGFLLVLGVATLALKRRRV